MREYVLFFLMSIFITFILISIPPASKINVYAQSDISNEFTENINIEKAKNLMIVAHPDDETIWGGDHLLEEDYLVVCVTCGTNKTRDKEIKKALSISDDELIKLGYPDNPGGIVNDWKNYKEYIENDLEKIITMKEYDKIVTHNPDGEYGHIHHKMLNKIVTRVSLKNNLSDKLYFFAKYYTKENMNYNEQKKFPIKNYDTKMYQMVKVYKSQSFIETSFSHVMGSEKFQKYSELKLQKDNKKIKA